MRGWQTTYRRWQEPQSLYWEETIDGKATGRIVRQWEDINDPEKILDWDFVEENHGKEPHAELNFYTKSQRIRFAKNGMYLKVLVNDPEEEVAKVAQRRMTAVKLKN